jgi:DNA (cytosine-5)-methyltransferase 1
MGKIINTIQQPLFSYKWLLNGGNGFPAKNIKYHGAKVFTCFSGGGGSSMGYRLAGYDVIGFNEIDNKQAICYKKNLGETPYQYIEDIRLLRKKKKLPDILFDLDILDGSPPCTTFSMCGEREKNWGKKKKFREGQEEQTLDDLSFEFLLLVKRLNPKIILIENVTGILIGNAVQYSAKIKLILKEMGYLCLHKILNGADMGLPQARRRVFFIAIRKDLVKNIKTYGLIEKIPRLDLNFNCKHIPFSEIDEGENVDKKFYLNKETITYKRWLECKEGDSFAKRNKNIGFTHIKVNSKKPLPTIVGGNNNYHYSIPRFLSDNELILGSSFPFDYNFCSQDIRYIAGMSVPPIMISNIAWKIKQEWLDKIKENK